MNVRPFVRTVIERGKLDVPLKSTLSASRARQIGLLSFLCISQATPASSREAQWQFVGSTNGGAMSVFYDKDRVSRQSKVVSTWVLTDFEEPQKDIPPHKYSSFLSYVTVKCGNESITSEEVAYYSERRGKGKVLFSEQGGDLRITPGTTISELYDILCN